AAWSNAPAAGDAFSIRSPAFQNNGSLLACQPQCGTVSLGGAETGTTTSLLIQPFATLPSFVNTGTLTSQLQSSSTSVSGIAAYGIRDLSGTLTDITNSGT